MLIGFTHKTSKILPRILCRRFRHCAITVMSVECGVWNYTMIQFTSKNNINLIPLKNRDIKILQRHGWVFIKYSTVHHPSYPFVKTSGHKSIIRHPLTCVGFAKKILGIRNPFIQTPDALYRYLKRESLEFRF